MNVNSALLIFFTLLQTIVLGQDRKTEPDSSYIKLYKEKLHLTTGIQTNNAEFILHYPNNLKYILSPDETYQQFFTLQYQLIRARYSFTPGYLNPTNSLEKGKNTRKEIGISFSVSNFDIDISRQTAKGYYIKNTKDYVNGWQNGSPYIQLPDLKTQVYALRIAYNTNNKFSIAGITAGNEAQMKTAYSFIPALTIYNIDFSLDAPIAPNSYGNDSHFDVNIKIPFAATFVINKKWYATAISGPIIGVNFFHTNYYNASLAKTTIRHTNLSTGYTIHSGLGYNGKKWYAGVHVFTEKYTSKVEEERNTRFFYGGAVYAGVRINPPKIIKKANDWLNGIFSKEKR